MAETCTRKVVGMENLPSVHKCVLKLECGHVAIYDYSVTPHPKNIKTAPCAICEQNGCPGLQH